MITDRDIKKLEEKFVTKADLLSVKLELKEDISKLEEKSVTNERFDQALGKLDYIIGELKEVREEQAAHSLRHDDIDREIAEIKSLPTVAHELKKRKSSKS